MTHLPLSRRIHTLVLAHDISSNALGRALSMGLVAAELGTVQILAFGEGKPWAGAVQFGLDVVPLGGNWKMNLDHQLADCSEAQQVVWVCKGIRPLPRAVRYLVSKYPEAIVILDLDDDDAGLASAFSSRSFLNKIRLLKNYSMLSRSILRAQRQVSSLARGFTFSSDALQSAYPPNYRPAVRIPHVRSAGLSSVEASRVVVPVEGASIRVGAYGTLRAHKGGELILEVIRGNRDLHLFTFAHCGLPPRDSSDVNWTEIAPSTPLAEAYALIDVAVVPITSRHRSAQLQFPAKLVDAMNAGVAVVASGTPPVQEYAKACFEELPDGARADEVADLIRCASQSDGGYRLRALYESELTPTVVAGVLNELIASLIRASPS